MCTYCNVPVDKNANDTPSPRFSFASHVAFEQDPIKAVEYIRDRRRGAINRKQLSYLDSYERRSRGNGCSSCTIM